jgi:hypothetical protein
MTMAMMMISDDDDDDDISVTMKATMMTDIMSPSPS